jgi:tetraacyldisaccharide 4'-kinase
MSLGGLELASDWIRLRLASRLEEPSPETERRFGVDALWSHFVPLVRRVHLPRSVFVVGVGGATLGGSGVTPLVREMARFLARRGSAVGVAMRAYRGDLRAPTVVSPGERTRWPGDEALEMSSALRETGVTVVAGGPLEARLERAAKGNDVVIVDGLLQTSPERLDLAILSLSGPRPWGAGRSPPSGDLRASPRRLTSLVDMTVHALSASSDACAGGAERAPSRVVGALRICDGFRVEPRALGRKRVGLILGIGHPERLVRALQDRGVFPARVIRLADHAGWRTFQRHERLARAEPVDFWLTTAKCATKLGSSYGGRQLWVVESTLELPIALRARLETLPPTRPSAVGLLGACLSDGGRAMVRPWPTIASSSGPR